MAQPPSHLLPRASIQELSFVMAQPPSYSPGLLFRNCPCPSLLLPPGFYSGTVLAPPSYSPGLLFRNCPCPSLLLPPGFYSGTVLAPPSYSPGLLFRNCPCPSLLLPRASIQELSLPLPPTPPGFYSGTILCNGPALLPPTPPGFYSGTILAPPSYSPGLLFSDLCNVTPIDMPDVYHLDCMQITALIASHT